MSFDVAGLADALTDIFEDVDPSATAADKAGDIAQALEDNFTDGSGGAVDSVFGRTGVVTAQTGDYTAAQVGADATGTAAAAIASHVADVDPHPTYTTAAEATSLASAAVGTHESTYAHTNLPSTDEKAALAGTSGTPSTSNRYVTDADARNTNARTPTTHAHSSHSGLGWTSAGHTGTAARLAAFDGAGAASEVALVSGGDLGGSLAAPEVTQARGLRETAGPTTLTMGAVADGQILQRVGSTIVGVYMTAFLVTSWATAIETHDSPTAEALGVIADAIVGTVA